MLEMNSRYLLRTWLYILIFMFFLLGGFRKNTAQDDVILFSAFLEPDRTFQTFVIVFNATSLLLLVMSDAKIVFCEEYDFLICSMAIAEVDDEELADTYRTVFHGPNLAPQVS